MRNRFVRGVATLAGLVLAGTGTAAVNATTAAADVYDCPAGYWCGWTGESATGQMFKTNKDVADLGSLDNTFYSYVNHTNLISCLYDARNYDVSGGYHAHSPDEAGAYTSYTRPSISSIKFVRTKRECGSPAYPYWFSDPSPTASGFGDMNADRMADVIVRDKAGRLWFTPGNGTGRLIGAGGWNSMSALTRHGDFSRDGREDLIAREAATGKLWLYPGTGTGSLGSRQLIGSGGWNSMRHITALGDLTGDGRSDLVAVEKATGKLYLYPGTSTGKLGPRTLIGSGGWNAMNALVGMGDTNGDRRPDLYAREAATGKLWLYPGTSTGRLGSRTLIGSGGWNAMANFIAVGDSSGDGRPDLHTVTNENYVIDGYPGNPGWLLTYQGLGNGRLASGVRTNGDWYLLNGFC
ncbi:ATP/GTP-binding protein [Wenjunlia vitaminophila]|uniref:ATP/GTP-binding protein n=1 Tax=Wenjunlia vitaminophila TaxID=76728 RepID=A0A0T6LZH1_WENVI|nr:FG-GAP-like repeat-containing protein [Wenjunlia vitaminophila]KRV51425.1 ATP/GTP-binding protein [Wenjunlia vitaminophila]